ncbi:uncharacterized protein LOC124930618 [Impatiens glandulifera]|uniref:uncharacterized protein LOC124930618 n=1 Tax=Impatiens glandulifera TaxID=253017 RepID=UPI001FB0F56C|nr:uncharacterized protein LOC124930618 [Impatiens glandulifera]
MSDDQVCLFSRKQEHQACEPPRRSYSIKHYQVIYILFEIGGVELLFRLKNWSELSQSQLNHIWQSISDPFESSTDIPIEAYRDKTMTQVKKAWDRWRYANKKTYIEPYIDDEDKIRTNPPPEFYGEDWNYLLDNHYFTSEFKKRSKTNADNRKKLMYPHHTGSKPFSQKERDMEREMGHPPSQAEFFLQTHTRKATADDPTPTPSPLVQQAVSVMRERLETNPNLSPLEVFESALGRQGHGRVTGMGSGIRPTHFRPDQRGSSSSSVNSRVSQQTLMEENRILREEINMIRAEQEAQKEAHEAQNEAQEKRINDIQAEVRAQKEAFEAFMSMISPPPPKP